MKKWTKILIGTAVAAVLLVILGRFLLGSAPPRVEFPEGAEVYVESSMPKSVQHQLSAEDAETVIDLFNSYSSSWRWWSDYDIAYHYFLFIGENQVVGVSDDYCSYTMTVDGETIRVELFWDEEDAKTLYAIYRKFY